MNQAARSEPIESLLGAIGARLPGPARPRDEILAELRDGLLEAAEANHREGLGYDESVQLALRQFGDAPTLAAAFWPEMAAARARRVVLTLFATGPIVAALWASAARSRGLGSETGLFDSGATHLAAGLLVAAAISCGIWTIVATGFMAQWLRVAPQAPLLGAAATGGIAVIADLALLSTLSVPLASFPGAIHKMALGAAILASGTRLILASHASWSCLAMRTKHGQTLRLR
jgi:hypothetical protein